MYGMTYKTTLNGALSTIIVASVLFLASPSALAQEGFGYGGGNLVTICKATRSPFVPYVKIAVPAVAAERLLARGSILPDAQGNCPRGISIQEYIWSRVRGVFS